MRCRPSGFRLALPVIGILLASGAFDERVAKAQNTWTESVPVVRNVKPRVKKYKVKPRPRQKVQVRLLSVQFRVLAISRSGTATEINPQAVFNPGDRLR